MALSKYTEITNAVYKLLEFFPEDEPLKNKTKEKALEIMENLVLVSLPDNPHPNAVQKGKAAIQALKDVEIIKGYLSLGRVRGWINDLNLMILFKEYDKIKEEIRPAAEFVQRGTLREETELGFRKTGHKTSVDNNVDNQGQIISFDGALTGRQDKILEILNNQEKAQVADFKKFLPDISKRTLRRDLDNLLKKGKIVRSGEWNQVFYQLYKDSSRSQTFANMLPESSRGLASGNKETLATDQNNQKVDGTALMS